MTLITFKLRYLSEEKKRNGRYVLYVRWKGSGNAFGNWFKDRGTEAGLPHCTPHQIQTHIHATKFPYNSLILLGQKQEWWARQGSNL